MIVALAVGTAASVLAAIAYWRLIHSVAPDVPALPGTCTSGAMLGSPELDGRTFTSYVPQGCPPNAPLLVVLHGSNGNAEQIRRYTGYEFEHLAEEHKFTVVYPNGYRGYWNDIRRKGGYAAKKRDIDDVKFLRTLVEVFQVNGAGPALCVGFSNGGQMCFRLAHDAPDTFAAIAAIAASMPTPDNSVSVPLERALSTMLVSGTDDPIVPYNGGRVTIFGFGDRGTVLSAPATAEYFAARLGESLDHHGPTELFRRSAEGQTAVSVRRWRAASRREVSLFTIEGGGHTIPQPRYRFFRLAGRTEMRLNAPAECWAFFQRALSADPRT